MCSIPLYGYTTVYLNSYLLNDILVVLQFGAITNKTSINIHVQVFGEHGFVSLG